MERLYDYIQDVAGTSSRTEKEKIIKAMVNFDEMKAVGILEAAYNPFRKYGIADSLTIPESVETQNTSLITDFHQQMMALLIKLEDRQLTGHAARDAVLELMKKGSFKEAWILQCILRKDLRCGISSSTVNKVFKKEGIIDLIPEFKTMLAHKYDPARIEQWPVYVEPKLDGMRCLAEINLKNKSVTFLSRNGKEITSIPHLEQEVLNLIPDDIPQHELWYLDGELTSGDNFNISISALRKKDETAQNAVFHLFDFITKGEFTGSVQTPMNVRIPRLLPFAKSKVLKPVSRYTVNTDEEVLALYQKMRDRDIEGIIVKPVDGTYEPKRSYNWMKIKECNDADLTVTGMFEGEGKYVGKLGGIIVDHGGVEVRVGSGFSDLEREELWGNDNIVGVTAEVQYHEVTPDGSLRHPRFIKFREDK